MKTIVRLVLAAALLGGFFNGAGAQGVGQLGPGQIWANPNAQQGLGQPTNISPWLDRAIGSTRGAILERGASGWALLTPGTSGLPFVSNGAAADPSYQLLPWASLTGTPTTIAGYGITDGLIRTNNLSDVSSAPAARTNLGLGSVATQNPGTGLANSGSNLNLQPASAGTIGGVNSIASLAHNWIAYIDTAGLPHQSQPSFADLSGTASAGQLPFATSGAVGGVQGDGATLSIAAGVISLNLSHANTWAAVQTFGDGDLQLSGFTSGASTIKAPATGGGTATLFAGTDTIAGKGLGNGGTNNSLTASNGGVVYSDASKLNILAGTVTAGQCLLSGSSAPPTWGSCTGGGSAVSAVANSDGTLTISPTTGSVTASLNLSQANIWAAVQTFTNSDLALLGSSTGKTTFTSDNAGASNFTIHVPAANDTLVALAATQTLTNKSIDAGQLTGTIAAARLPAGVPAGVLNSQTSNYSIATTDCGKTIQAGTGATGLFTVTLPAVTGFASNCTVTVWNADTGRGKTLSGFPSPAASILWPLQHITVAIVNGVWADIDDPGRWRITADTTWNVNHASGSNSADGLGTGASAFATNQFCVDTILKYVDGNGFNVICQGVAETFTENVICQKRAVGSLQISLLGTSSTSQGTVDTFIWQFASGTMLSVSDGCLIALQGYKVVATGSSLFGLASRNFANIDLKYVDFDSFPGSFSVHLSVAQFGTINLVGGGTVWISSSVGFHIFANSNGAVTGAGTLSIAGSLTWGTAFISIADNAMVDYHTETMAGAGTGTNSAGTACSVTYNAVLNRQATVIPGAASPACTTAASATQGGQIQ